MAQSYESTNSNILENITLNNEIHLNNNNNSNNNNNMINNNTLPYESNNYTHHFNLQMQELNVDNTSKQLKRKRRTVNQSFVQYHHIENEISYDLSESSQSAVVSDQEGITVDSYSYRYNGKLWNEQMDEILINYVTNNYPNKDWKAIALLINQKLNLNILPSQVCKRWNQYLAPDVVDRKSGPWSEQEVIMLHSLVESYSRDTAYSKSLCRWEPISKALNRRYYDVQNKWNTIKKSTLKVGRFTIEEDHIITQTVLDWNLRGIRQGLWTHLETILCRRNDVIRHRWKHVLSKKLEP